jgi:hypothetical protein
MTYSGPNIRLWMEGEFKNKEDKIIYEHYNSKKHKSPPLFWRGWEEDTNDMPCLDT